jgi:ribonucleotide reductase alpha subunit
MTIRKPSIDFVRGIEGFVSPTQCLNDLVEAWTNYRQIAEQEKTKRREIEVWEKTTLAEIKAKRDLFIGYLDRSFDERAENFRSLFEAVDRAMLSDDDRMLGLTLQTIVELAKSNPFKDLADLSIVKAALDDPNHVWGF